MMALIQINIGLHKLVGNSDVIQLGKDPLEVWMCLDGIQTKGKKNQSHFKLSLLRDKLLSYFLIKVKLSLLA